MGIEARHRHLEESLETLQDIFFDIGRLHGELWQAISDLEPKMEAENFSNVSTDFVIDISLEYEQATPNNNS